MEEHCQGGNAKGASANTTLTGRSSNQAIPQEETQEGEGHNEVSASIAKSASEFDQVIRAQSSSKAGIIASDTSDNPATTGSVASRCPTTTGNIHNHIFANASCEFMAVTPVPSKVETNSDVNLILSEVVSSEDSVDDEEADSETSADDKCDAFDVGHDIAPASSRLTIRSVISKRSHASKRSMISAAHISKSNVTTASRNSESSKFTASATRSLKSTKSTKSKSNLALQSTKSDAE